MKTTPQPSESRRHLWLAAALFPILLAQPWMMAARSAGLPAPWDSLTGMVLALALFTATATDLARRRIFNWCTYSAIAWAGVLQLVSMIAGDAMIPGGLAHSAEPVALNELIGGPTPTDCLAGLAIGFGVTFALYTVFHGGAGDVKLVAAVGALIGPVFVLQAMVYAYVLAAIAAACWLIWTVGPIALAARLWISVGLPAGETLRAHAAAAQSATRRRMPMGPFHAAGAVLALTWLPN